MEGEVLAPARAVPWRGLGAATAVAAIGAFVLNLALGRALVMGIPEGGGAAPAVESPADGASPATAGADPTGEGIGSAPGGDAVAAGIGAPAGARVTEADYREAILGRNLFDAARIGVGVGVECEGEDCPTEGPVGIEIAGTLTGTVVSDMPAYSAAFFLDEGKTSAVAYGIGQDLQGAEVVEIQKDRIRVRKGTDEAWLLLGQKNGGKTASTSTPAPTGEGEAAPAEGGVTKNSETSYTIDRALWDSKMGDITSLTREARALQHRGPDGNYDGYRLSAIRRGSLADSLGIKNGDIIHNINGLGLDSVDNAMKAFDTMRSDSNFKIEVTRRGQPVTLEYGVK